MLFWKISRSVTYMKFELPHSRKGECMWRNQEMEACRNERRLSHSFASWSAFNGRVARWLKVTSNGAGVKNTELQISKSRIGEAPAPAFSNSVFSPLSTIGNAVVGRAASGKRRGRHCHHITMFRYAITSSAVTPLWSLHCWKSHLNKALTVFSLDFLGNTKNYG